MTRLTGPRAIALAVFFPFVAMSRVALADVQCFGTVQSAIVDATTGNVTLTLVPTPPSTTVCPSPCNPDSGTGWTFLDLAASSSSRTLVYAGGLAAVLSGRPVFLFANTTPLPGGASCQITRLQVKAS